MRGGFGWIFEGGGVGEGDCKEIGGLGAEFVTGGWVRRARL